MVRPLTLSLLLLCGLSTSSLAQGGGPEEAFKAIYQQEWRWRQDIDGEPAPGKQRDRLPRMDPASQAERSRTWQRVLRELAAIQPASLPVNAAEDYAVYKLQIETLLANQDFREFEKPIYGDTSFWGNVAYMTRAELASDGDATAYIALLNDIPRFFSENVANMRAGLKRGFTPPRFTLTGRDATLRSVAEARRPEDTAFYGPMRQLPASIPAERQEELRRQAREAIARAVIPAHQKALAFFVEEYVPRTRTSSAAIAMPQGKAYYQSRVREFTTLDIDPDEVHRIGLTAVADIRRQMADLMREVGFQGDFPAFLKFLRSDKQFYATTPEQLLREASWIAKQVDAAVPRYFGHLPRQRFAIIPVPADLAPFYTSGRGGPGMYQVNTYDLPSRPLYSLRALTLHEAAPGHAFQIPLAAENRRQPPFRREIYISAYGEGWALYCEKLGLEMGLYPTAYDRFGMLSYQMWRAVRLVVDTGIHTKGWSREQAQAFLRDNSALSERELVNEIDRYFAYPGQALAFYLGQTTIEQARRKAEQALGPRFDIRAFHDTVLELGFVPLPVLTQRVDRFIAEGGVSPFAGQD